jgi:leader peptidase (prepilin peptidase)/N-methyltransferase
MIEYVDQILIKGAGVVLFLFLLLMIAREDLKTKRIPDKYLAALVFPGITVSKLFLLISLQERIIGAVTVSAVMLLCSVIRPKCFGGGDVKFMMVIGLIIGKNCTIWAFVVGVLSAGIYIASRFLLNRKVWKNSFAFGPFLCAGIIVSLFSGDYLTDWFLGS